MRPPLAAPALLAVLLLLAGCSAAPETRLAPTRPPAETATGPTLQGRSAALQPVRSAVPPVRLVVESAGIDIPVDPVGVRGDGEMEVPADISRGGWYRYGADPASATGSTVIAAHVDSFDAGIGPFAYLKTLTAGQQIQVTTSDGAEHRYAVETVVSVPRDQLPADDVFDRDGSPRLVLITCGGQFGNGEYSDNVIVVAVPQ